MKFAFYVSGHGYGVSTAVSLHSSRSFPFSSSDETPLTLILLLQHATRVAALSTELLQHGHSITIVTNAPPLPFASILPPSALPPSSIPESVANAPKLAQYAQYRNRNVDAGIVQPKAYDVDRQKTLEVLQKFMNQRNGTLEIEIEWLKEEKMDAVLSDATFLGW